MKSKHFPDLVEFYRLIQEANGITLAELTRQLNGPSYSSVVWALISLEDRGYLLYETDQGVIYPFDPKSRSI